MDHLVAIKESRGKMVEIRERMYERALALEAERRALTPEDVDKAGLELEAARIELAEAEIEILKAQAGNGTT
jgi:hypothetical protein